MDTSKEEILSLVVGELSGNLTTVREGRDETRRDANESEGAMVSRYNSAKEELGYLADALGGRATEIGAGIARLTALHLPENPERVCEGALVRVRVEDRRTHEGNYFVLPYGGGTWVKADDQEILVVTPEAPIAKGMMGMLAHGTFRVPEKDRRYTILDIK